MTITKWVKCPLCGEADMRAEYEDEHEEGLPPIITCVNHGCVSNTGYPENGGVDENSLNYLQGFFDGHRSAANEHKFFLEKKDSYISALEQKLKRSGRKR